jgi:hypothetical protein
LLLLFGLLQRLQFWSHWCLQTAFVNILWRLATLEPILRSRLTYNAASSLARFEDGNIFFCFENRSSLLRWRCSCM